MSSEVYQVCMKVAHCDSAIISNFSTTNLKPMYFDRERRVEMGACEVLRKERSYFGLLG